MAAISSICQLFKAGDEFIFTNNIYGGTYRLMENIMNKFSLKADWVDTSCIDNIKNSVSENTKIIFIRANITISNIANPINKIRNTTIYS